MIRVTGNTQGVGGTTAGRLITVAGLTVALLLLGGCQPPQDAPPSLPRADAPADEWGQWADRMTARGRRIAEADTALSGWFMRRAAWEEPAPESFASPVQDAATGDAAPGLTQWEIPGGIVVSRAIEGGGHTLDTLRGACGAVISSATAKGGAPTWEYVAGSTLHLADGPVALPPMTGWALHGYYGPWGVCTAPAPRGTAVWMWRRGGGHQGLLIARGEEGLYGPLEARGDTLTLWHMPRGGKTLETRGVLPEGSQIRWWTLGRVTLDPAGALPESNTPGTMPLPAAPAGAGRALVFLPDGRPIVVPYHSAGALARDTAAPMRSEGPDGPENAPAPLVAARGLGSPMGDIRVRKGYSQPWQTISRADLMSVVTNAATEDCTKRQLVAISTEGSTAAITALCGYSGSVTFAPLERPETPSKKRDVADYIALIDSVPTTVTLERFLEISEEYPTATLLMSSKVLLQLAQEATNSESEFSTTAHTILRSRNIVVLEMTTDSDTTDQGANAHVM